MDSLTEKYLLLLTGRTPVIDSLTESTADLFNHPVSVVGDIGVNSRGGYVGASVTEADDPEQHPHAVDQRYDRAPAVALWGKTGRVVASKI